MSNSIRLSPKHGVNPSVELCFYCGEPKGVALFGLMRGRERSDPEAPRSVVLNHEPCDKCVEHMKQGIIFIEVADGEEGDNPYRTGGFAVVKDDAVRRLVQPAEYAEQIIKRRMAYVPREVWVRMGLPTKEAAS